MRGTLAEKKYKITTKRSRGIYWIRRMEAVLLRPYCATKILEEPV